MRHQLDPLTGLVAAVVLTAVFIGHLVDPGSLLALRDVPVFHLPLRTLLVQAAADGVPWWNPATHGGQPILSNPNYAAFYPPTWLAAVVSPAYSIHLIVLLHAVFAYLGAWRLARHLGCRSAAAFLAATAFTFGGGALSTINLLTIFCGLAWLPWILLWSDRDSDPASGLVRRTLPVAGGFALQILAGEPVIVLTTGLAAGCLAVARLRSKPERLGRLALGASLALLLAAVQIVPTWNRVQESARAEGLGADSALSWSSPPERLGELFLPHLYGDPMRADESLYFGWHLHDRQYPYLVSIYGSQLLLLLALAGWLRWPLARRAGWIAMAVLGIGLALGRYNPLYRMASELLPVFEQIRFPEKFLLLTTTAISFSGALAWQHLIDRRRDRGPALGDFPLALAGAAVAIVAAFFALLKTRPDVGEWFVRKSALMAPTPEQVATGAAFLGSEVAVALVFALAGAALLALHRRRRTADGLLVVLTLALVSADLFFYNRNLTPTLDLTDLESPPTALADLDPDRGRIVTDLSFMTQQNLTLRSDKKGSDILWATINRADPYTANLWGFSYALEPDFDLMATRAARDAFDTLGNHWHQPEVAQAILGSWSVRHLLYNRPVTDVVRDRLEGGHDGPLPLMTTLDNPRFEPQFRLADSVELHRDSKAAAAAAERDRFERQHWVATAGDAEACGPTGAAGEHPPQPSSGAGRLEILEEKAARVRLAVSGAGGSEPVFVVAARTWDRGWRARIDGRNVPVFRTALGQIGICIWSGSSGRFEVELFYRDRWVLLGLAISLATLLGLAAAQSRRRLHHRRRRLSL